jgi:hypothetical protein
MAGANSGLIVEAAADLMPLRSREMPLLRIAFLAAVLMVAAGGVGDAWENTPLLNIYQVAYPVVWNGKTIMIGARLQLPAGTKGKMPAVIMMHGTGDIKYSGVYYVAALNGAGIVTFEVRSMGRSRAAWRCVQRPKNLGDNLPDCESASEFDPSFSRQFNELTR